MGLIVAVTVAVLLFLACAGGLGWVVLKQRQQNTAGVEKLREEQKSMVSDMRKALNDPKTAPGVMQKDITKFSEQLGNTASGMGGKPKQIVEATQHFLQLAAVHLQKYNAAHDAFGAGWFYKAKGDQHQG